MQLACDEEFTDNEKGMEKPDPSTTSAKALTDALANRPLTDHQHVGQKKTNASTDTYDQHVGQLTTKALANTILLRWRYTMIKQKS